jgi:hypothetical protein
MSIAEYGSRFTELCLCGCLLGCRTSQSRTHISTRPQRRAAAAATAWVGHPLLGAVAGQYVSTEAPEVAWPCPCWPSGAPGPFYVFRKLSEMEWWMKQNERMQHSV